MNEEKSIEGVSKDGDGPAEIKKEFDKNTVSNTAVDAYDVSPETNQYADED